MRKVKKKRVCVVTGARAEFGILQALMRKIKRDPMLSLQLVVTGTHFSSKYGLTYKEIEKEGFKIDEKVDISPISDSDTAIAKSLGKGVAGFANTFVRLWPDIVVLLGDRYEVFSAAIAAFISRIPIGHIHGGELTEGAIDDAIRHSITKMSCLHFVSTQAYGKRVMQLGENPVNIFNIGALSLDNIKRLKLLSKESLEKSLNFEFGKKNMLVTFHPVTLEKNTSERYFKELLRALDYYKDFKIIFTKPNGDIQNRVIAALIDTYVRKNKKRTAAFASMGYLNYLSAIRHVDAVVGNSSSGIIEVPYFKKPTINIGDRQRGRVKPKSVINCSPDRESIKQALKKALSERFKRSCEILENPYEAKNSAATIVKVLKERTKTPINLKKRFFDIKGIGQPWKRLF